VVMGICWLGS